MPWPILRAIYPEPIRGVYPERGEWAQGKLREWARDDCRSSSRTRPPSATSASMLLLLIRHAHAGARDPERWPDDNERPLTDKGRKTQRQVSRALGKLELAPTSVLTSPWARAAETAAILVQELALPYPAIPCTALAGPPELSRLADEIGKPGSNATVALVGHSPWIEELAAL